MSFETGRMLSHYRLVEKIGEGGMGVVWKALDTTLDREVAIKVLPEAFSLDADRLARFEREAKLLASLKHPNIAAIYGLHEAEGVRFLAMEFIAGEDLSALLDRRPLSIPEVLQIGGQLVDALEAAHDSGIIHRDLKPANILIESGNRVKVLDFGLARSLEAPGGSADSSLSPTLTSLGTIAGAIMGTAAYMSPEQARGDVADRRADIWSLGCVIYEMLAGERPFRGATVSDTLAAVLKSDPEWDRLPAGTPPSLDRLLRRCLAKPRRERLHAVADARLELEEAAREGEVGPKAAGAPPRSQAARFAPWLVAAIALAVAGTAWLGGPVKVTPASEAVRFHIDIGAPNLSGGATPIAVSDDGGLLAYSALSGTDSLIYLHRLDEFKALPLSSSENGNLPFFAPDGQWIGYFARGRLLKQSLVGGLPQELAVVPHAPGGASWGTDGTIVFATAWARNGLHAVSAAGGEARVLTEPNVEAGEQFHYWPQVLPDGDSVLFTVSGDRGRDAAILSLKSGRWELLPGIRGRALYVESGQLLYGDGEKLLAVPFDLASREIGGPPVPVLDTLPYALGSSAAVDASDRTLIHATWTLSEFRLVWMGRNGSREYLPGGEESWERPRLSPDGTQLLVQTSLNQTLRDLRRGSEVMLEDVLSPSWTPDGKSLVHSSRITGVAQVYVQPVGGGQRRQVAKSEHALWVDQVSPDGRHVAFYEQHPETGRDIWIAELEEGGKSEPLIVSPANERSTRFSPDGKWIAYTSDRSGRDEVYVRRFEPRGEQDHLISTAGGREPIWSPDGDELYYRSGNLLLAVTLKFLPEFRASSPTTLLEGNWAINPGGLNQMYDVGPDGRFLMIEGISKGKIAVITGWQSALGGSPGQ